MQRQSSYYLIEIGSTVKDKVFTSVDSAIEYLEGKDMYEEIDNIRILQIELNGVFLLTVRNKIGLKASDE